MRVRYWVTAAVVAGLAGAAIAQVETIDPNAAAARAAKPGTSAPPPPAPEPVPMADQAPPPLPSGSTTDTMPRAEDAKAQAHAAAGGGQTYQENDVLAAAEGVFGRGAEGLAKMIENIFKKQGRPNGYIVGREGSGAIVVGVRYGSGTLFHKVEGQRPVYWQGPSVGFDLGANGSKTFMLVYNLYDTQDLFKRFPAAEGNLYVVGGFTANYLRWHDVVLVPIHLGVGWRAGINGGYMRFTEKRHWSPF